MSADGVVSSYRQTYRALPLEVRRFVWLSATIELMYVGIYLAAFNLYLLRIGFGPEFVGTALGSSIGVYSITCIVAGYLARRRWLRSLVIVGVLIMAFGLIAITFADVLPATVRPIWILCTNSIAWLGGACCGVGRLAYLAAMVPAKSRVEIFTMENFAGAVLGFLGGVVAAVVPLSTVLLFGWSLDDPAPYRLTLVLGPAALIPPLLLFVKATRHAAPIDEDPEASPLTDVTTAPKRSPLAMIVMLSVYAVLIGLAGTPVIYFFNVYLDTKLSASPALIGFIMGVARLGSVAAMVVVPILSRRWSIGGLSVSITLVLAGMMIPLAVFPEVVIAAASYLVISALLAISEPIFDVYRVESVSSKWQGHMAGITQTAAHIAQAAGGVASGRVAVAFGYSFLFLGGAGLAVVAGVVLWIGARAIGKAQAVRRSTASLS